ncbi:hypothetical protein [Pseudomonas sp. A2]|uniref:hypothetical protein n=1 Tax=Pseudomonas sp. A2 TaxID=107445 RepID=UPI001FFE933B|nr:hypothetical protein [Pseudomonas sp. A2]UPK86826.1 hypothetical protein E5221_18370 [Pseudomonas sp. A2]
MKRTLAGIALAGEPLLRQALEAIRAHRAAEENGSPIEEVERLRLLADSLYNAAIDYQLVAAAQPPTTIQ